MVESLIDQAKQIPASTIAERYGLELKKRGERYWTCCPLHTEKHPSLCFYPDGSWYCFSCLKGGDSVALLASMKNISMYDAAKEICGVYHPAAAGPVIRNAYQWREQRIQQLRKTIRKADEYTGQYTVETAEQAWDDPVFIAAIKAKQQANWEIDELYDAGKHELNQLMIRGC